MPTAIRPLSMGLAFLGMALQAFQTLRVIFLFGDLRDHLAHRIAVCGRLIRLQIGLRGVEPVQPVVDHLVKRIGIAVALMGRSHPAGIVPAAILFGALYQGGSELAFEVPTFTSDMVVVIQGLVILFSGALENIFRRPIGALFRERRVEGPA